MKGGIDWSLRISGVERYIIIQDICLLILSREIDKKLCQNFTKTYIYQIVYKIRKIVEYGLFNTTNLIQNLIYTFWYNFDTVLYQFLETDTSDRTLMGRDKLLSCLGFSLYPRHFSFTVPFSSDSDVVNLWHVRRT